MRIDIEALQDDGRPLQLTLHPRLKPLTMQGVTYTFPEPADVTVLLSKESGRIWAGVEARIRYRTACTRCLRPIESEVSLRYQEAFRQPEQPPLAEDEQDDVRDSVYTDDAIDLEPGLIEQFILQLPMKQLCRPQCRGLCPQCGQDLNERDCGCREATVDPRLAGLADLLNNEA